MRVTFLVATDFEASTSTAEGYDREIKPILAVLHYDPPGVSNCHRTHDSPRSAMMAPSPKRHPTSPEAAARDVGADASLETGAS